ncbi:MAG: DNA primase [Qingshengfaniella sp.]
MSLPPGFLDELRTRISLSQIIGRRVTWDPRKSNQGKGDFWAPCPFHQEKTASFHVDDRKGFYYCFGCHAKGDLISFVRETENLGFMEAVERLAGEAGMQMPARDPRAQEKSDRRGELTEIMEMAVRHFRRQLAASGGAAARDYLDGRGMDEGVRDRFGIGFAPDARRVLYQDLTAQGVAEDRLIAAGLCARPDDGGALYDRFRGRIIFPIRDARGRCIAFGGRAMAANARAKYLNSPETEIFDKGRTLFNLGPAREAAGAGQPLIVAEGYVDVIALSEAGFTGAVAPLGTAITEHQLAMLWRVSPEPIVALDGDRAGLNAAKRLIDLALPVMTAGQGLRFAIMPPDQDPDDVIRKGGVAAMRAVLDGARPMIDLLWQRETEGKPFDSPERRAALDQRLMTLTAGIADTTLRHHYRQDLKQRQWQLGRLTRPGGGKRRPAAPPATSAARQSLLASAPGRVEEDLREAAILAILIRNPDLLPRFEDLIEPLDFVGPGHSEIRDALLDWIARPEGAVADHVAAAVGGSALDMLFSHPHVALIPALRSPGSADLAAQCLAEELNKLTARRGLMQELAEATQSPRELADARLAWRLREAAEANNMAGRPTSEDRSEYDLGENGARMDRGERSLFDSLISTIDFTKGRRS